MYDNIKYFENTQYKHKSFQGYFLYVIMNRIMVLVLSVEKISWKRFLWKKEKTGENRKPERGPGFLYSWKCQKKVLQYGDFKGRRRS